MHFLLTTIKNRQIFSKSIKGTGIDLRSIFANPKLPIMLMVLVFILLLPILVASLNPVDYAQMSKFVQKKDKTPYSIAGMYSFFNNKVDVINNKKDISTFLPAWWCEKNIRINFWRPLSEITHAFDMLMWPKSSMMMHLHTILWFVCMVGIIAVCYRRIMGIGWPAGLAAFLYAIDDAHGTAIVWWSNRHVIIATIFSVLAIIVHDKWRKDGWKPGAVIGPTCLIIGLLFGEAGIGIVGYILAYALYIDKSKIIKKMIAILPYGVIAVAWWIVYKYLGYGVSGSGVYIDPGQYPIFFIKSIFERFPILFMGQMAMPPSQTYMYLPKSEANILWYCAFVFFVFTMALFIPLLRRNQKAKFWLLGMVIAQMIICAGSIENRNLFFVGLGAMGLLSLFISGWFDRSNWVTVTTRWQCLYKNMNLFFITVHVVLALILLPLSGVIMDKDMDNYARKPSKNSILDYHSGTEQIILLNFPKGDRYIVLQMIQRKINKTPTTPLKLLSSGNVPIKIVRLSNQAIEVHPYGGFMVQLYDTFFRSPTNPMKIGQKVTMGKLTAEVLSLTSDKRPEKVKFSGNISLDDPYFKFIQWDEGEYKKLSLPAVGETLIVNNGKMHGLVNKIFYYF